MHLSVPRDEDDELRVLSNWGYTVQVHNIKLTDYPDGGRTVSIEGRHIRKDDTPGAHRRAGRWDAPEELPENLAAEVEAARPGWWAGGSS